MIDVLESAAATSRAVFSGDTEKIMAKRKDDFLAPYYRKRGNVKADWNQARILD